MITEEKLREIMLSEELSDSEKLDRLHATQTIERWLSSYRNDATAQSENWIASARLGPSQYAERCICRAIKFWYERLNYGHLNDWKRETSAMFGSLGANI